MPGVTLEVEEVREVLVEDVLGQRACELRVRGPQHRADARVIVGRCGAHGDAEQGVDFHAFSLRSQVLALIGNRYLDGPQNCLFSSATALAGPSSGLFSRFAATARDPLPDG